jgi:hypothetical protein
MAAKKNPFAKMAAAKGKKAPAPAKGKMPMAFGKKKAC